MNFAHKNKKTLLISFLAFIIILIVVLLSVHVTKQRTDLSRGEDNVISMELKNISIVNEKKISTTEDAASINSFIGNNIEMPKINMTHNVTFDLENRNFDTVETQFEIEASIKDKDGIVIDPSKLIIIDGTKKQHGEKLYLCEETAYKNKESIPVDKSVSSIKYIYKGDIFEGLQNQSDEPDMIKQDGGKSVKSYVYKIGIINDENIDYKTCKIEIRLTVKARINEKGNWISAASTILKAEIK